MKLLRMSLRNFRNHSNWDVVFDDKTIVTGGNGTGKSNLLEAVYLLAVGKSFKTGTDGEMIAYGKPAGKITGETDEGDTLEVLLVSPEAEAGRKKFLVNGVARRSVDFAGRLKVIMFGPTDLELVSGSPSGRRRYMDGVLSQADREYHRSLISYEKGLRQRNKLLDLLRDGRAQRTQLYFWDRLLVKNGQYITDARKRFLDFVQREEGEWSIVYDKSEISDVRLAQYSEQEVATGSTLVGPHRDDFFIQLAGRNVAKFGSRGEQRMGVLWMKKGERDFLTGDGPRPVLLLDDVFSELDHAHRDEVMRLVEEHIQAGGQTIMTTADEHLLPGGKWAQIILGDNNEAVGIRS